MGSLPILESALPIGAPAVAGHACAELRGSVVSNSAVNEEYRHLVVSAPAPAVYAGAGQFFNLLCPASGDDRPFLRRPMSVYRASQREGNVEFLYRVTGAGTRALASLAPGDGIDMLGPLGRGFSLADDCRHLLAVGRGVGLATLAPLADLARERGVPMSVVLSARADRLLMSAARFEACGAEVITVTDERGDSDVRNVEAIVRSIIETRGTQLVGTCGSNRLMQLVKRLVREYGIEGAVALEQQMACGLGMCQCCVRNFERNGQHESRRVCTEGPVFDIREALSW